MLELRPGTCGHPLHQPEHGVPFQLHILQIEGMEFGCRAGVEEREQKFREGMVVDADAQDAQLRRGLPRTQVTSKGGHPVPLPRKRDLRALPEAQLVKVLVHRWG